MSGSAGNLPVRIVVEGAPAAEAAFNSVATTGERAMARVAQGTTQASAASGTFRQAIGSAGFQLQDFAVQVQGGTSALTALSQQGSQFLGVFGPAGAIAGAVLTVGILVAQVLNLRSATDEAAVAAGAYTRAMEASNEVLATSAARSREQAAVKRREAQEAIGLAIAIERENLARANSASSRETDRLARIDEQVRQGLATPENAALRRGQAGDAARGIADAALRIDERITALEAQRRALDVQGVDLGEQFGPPAPAAAARRTAADRRADRPGMDVQGAVTQSYNDAATALDAYNERLNLNSAGLQNAAGALSQYERDMGTLNAALANGVITEDQFAASVEASSVALTAQIAAAEQRGQRTNDIGRQLGLTFSSAFEDAISKGKSFSDVLKGVAADIAKIITRLTITQPLASALQNSLGGVNLGGFMSSIFGASSQTGLSYGAGPSTASASAGGFLFANGGIMTGGGPVPLRKYAGGGIANSPQMAVFGEGRMAEAYVPLPDGRSIPVTMQGGGGGIVHSPVFNIDARGADPSVLPRMQAIAERASANAVAQLVAQVNRGGSVAKTFGRRA